MPLHLEPRDAEDDLQGVTSVLVVCCPVCPPVSLAVREGGPLIDLFRSGLKTAAFEEHVRKTREALEARGVRTGVATLYAPVPTMCLWTRRQRRRLFRRAEGYEAALVLGCASAAHTVRQALATTDCRVVTGMRLTGITSAAVTYRFPMTIELDETACVDTGERQRAQPGSGG